MKWLFYLGSLCLVVGCTVSLPNKMAWKDYHIARHALHVTYNRADVLGCEDLGSVHGRSNDDVGSAKEKAMSAAVLMGADHLLLEQIEADLDTRSAYLPLPMSDTSVHVYGTAYRCGKCPQCASEIEKSNIPQ
ncbi:MAG: hypothetical protein C0619_07415 [Desulfuromonas sp.]|nr:MAG: hypothetical protein C0619_07415 [Desulfuromonas sp.]